MANSDNCPNCDNIYGNEPRKIPCNHIVCHKCCLELFNKEDNTLECPVCYKVHTFKSKNLFKKSLQQVAHSGFGKKTSTREMSFASTMPMEKASGAEKSSNKEVKKAAANVPTAPPGAPPETFSSSAPPQPPPLLSFLDRPPTPTSTATPPPPPPLLAQAEPVNGVPKPSTQSPVPLMPIRSSMTEFKSSLPKIKHSTPPVATPPSLFHTIVAPIPPPPPPPPVPAVPLASDAVIARCHSCGNKCQVVVCEHCDHFVCLKCAGEHMATTKVDIRGLTNKWQGCKTKYSSLMQKLNQYDRDRHQIASDLAAIRVAVEQRTRDAIEAIVSQRDSLLHRIDDHLEGEQRSNGVKHHQLTKEFQTIQNRLENALNGDSIGAYTQDDFLRDISQLQLRMNQRSDLIEAHILKIPTVSRYEQVSIEKLLGELRFNNQSTNNTRPLTISPLMNQRHAAKQNGYAEHSTTTVPPPPSKANSGTTPSNMNNITPPSQHVGSTNETTNVKPLMADVPPTNPNDDFDKFRRMAAHIHQLFNAPYSKVINAASSPPSMATTLADGSQTNNGHDKNARVSSNATVQNISISTGTFVRSWKIEHSAVPNFLCMTPYPTPKVFVVDKYGKVSVCSIPPKLIKPIESYTLFADRTDEWIESVVASSRYLIVYSRKKQDTMTGTLYFFTHECKQVPPLNGIHQSIPVHHILCDQTGNRIYCLDRMRCNIYYHTLPTNPTEIEACMKQRCDFIHFNTNFCALKMLQNDTILGFYEKNYRTVHLYDKQTAEKIDEFKCEHFTDKFESWGIIAIRKDNNTLIFKVDECVEPDAVARQHIVYEVNRTTKQVIAKIQLSSVFGMILGPSNEVILGIRQAKDSGLVQCYMRKSESRRDRYLC